MSLDEYDIGEIERNLSAHGVGGYRAEPLEPGGAAFGGRYTIRTSTGAVDVNGSVTLRTPIEPTGICWVGVQFGTVRGSFDFGHNPTITSLKGIPRLIVGNLTCWESGIANFSGIDKLVDRIAGNVNVHEHSTHLLGLLLIKGITRINVKYRGNTSTAAQAHDMLNKYISAGNQDILSAQDELIDAGFTEQARL